MPESHLAFTNAHLISLFILSFTKITISCCCNISIAPSTHFTISLFLHFLFPENIDERMVLLQFLSTASPGCLHVAHALSISLLRLQNFPSLIQGQSDYLFPGCHVLLMYSGVCSYNSPLCLQNHQIFLIIPISIEYVILSLNI